MRDIDQSVSGNAPSHRSLLWAAGGGLIAALCCAGPLVALFIGIGGATSVIGLVRFKWEFLALGLLVTLVGIGVSLRRGKAGCSISANRRNRIVLPIAGVLIVLLIVFGSQYLLLNDTIIGAASSRLSDQLGRPDQNSLLAAPAAHQLDVAVTSGVNCAACLLAIQQQLMEVPGVASAEFIKSPEAEFTVRVVYDPGQISQALLLVEIADAPGSANGVYGTMVIRDLPIG